VLLQDADLAKSKFSGKSREASVSRLLQFRNKKGGVDTPPFPFCPADSGLRHLLFPDMEAAPGGDPPRANMPVTRFRVTGMRGRPAHMYQYFEIPSSAAQERRRIQVISD
jgi:hypothetical protein